MDADLGLWVIADGLGGHTDGHLASKIACESIHSVVKDGYGLSRAIQHAHQAILQAIGSMSTPSNMGSTVVALHRFGDECEVGWVGDSRAYHLHGERLAQLTTDHSHMADAISRGEITASSARESQVSHVLSQSLGVSHLAEVEPEFTTCRISPGDCLLLCSDGLSNAVADVLLTEHLAERCSADATAEKLLSAALETGGYDNISLVVLRT